MWKSSSRLILPAIKDVDKKAICCPKLALIPCSSVPSLVFFARKASNMAQINTYCNLRSTSSSKLVVQGSQAQCSYGFLFRTCYIFKQPSWSRFYLGSFLSVLAAELVQSWHISDGKRKEWTFLSSFMQWATVDFLHINVNTILTHVQQNLCLYFQLDMRQEILDNSELFDCKK